MATLYDLTRQFTVLIQELEFYLNDSIVEPESFGSVDITYVDSDETLYTGLNASKITNGKYTVSKTVPTYTVKVGFYQIVVRNVKFPNHRLIKEYKANIFKVSAHPQELADEGSTWHVQTENVTSIYRRDKDTQDLDDEIFTYRPYTFFFEEDEYIYTSEANYANYIPVVDKYIFPSAPALVNTGLLAHYQQSAQVGVSIPVTYVYTSPTYGGFQTEAYQLLSGLSALQYSSSGNLIYTDEGKALYSFWNDTHRSAYLDLVNIHTSGLDFVFYRDFADFNDQLRIETADPMLDYETYGWAGTEPFNTNTWVNGLYKFVQSGTSADLFDNRRSWFPNYFSGLSRFIESPASFVIGTLTQDTSWQPGEIWNFIQRLRKSGQPTYIAATYQRNANELDYKLGKALALLTDSYYSPGQANYSLFQNYTQAQYSKYNIGDPIGPPLKSGNTIIRAFSNGLVQVPDNGTQTTESVKIFVGIKGDAAVSSVELPTSFLSMQPANSNLYSDYTSSELDTLAVADYWEAFGENVYNEAADFSQLVSGLYGRNSDIVIGADLYFTDWPEDRWAAEYGSGLTTAGASYYPILSGAAYDSINYKLYWYDFIRETNLDFYVLTENETEIPVSHVSWITAAFPRKQILFRTARTDFPHNHLIITGISSSSLSTLKSAGKYIWSDNFDAALDQDLGYSELPIDLNAELFNYTLTGVLPTTFSGQTFDQTFFTTLEGTYVDAVHATQKIVTINSGTQEVTYSGNWPEGTFSNGFFDDTLSWYTTPASTAYGDIYWGSRPLVRRSCEYGNGYIMGKLADIDFSGRDTRIKSAFEWLRDQEQIFKDPRQDPLYTGQTFRTGKVNDGGFVAWLYRPGAEIPNDETRRFIDGATITNMTWSNWFSTGRALEFGSKAYAYDVFTSGASAGDARYLSMLNIAANNIINKGSPFALPQNENVAGEWPIVDSAGSTDYPPNINYHASALNGLCAAYKVGGVKLIDPNNTTYSGIVRNDSNTISNVYSGVAVTSATNVIDGDYGTTTTWENTFVSSGALFDVGYNLGLDNAKIVYKYEIVPDPNNLSSRPTGWELLAVNHVSGMDTPDEYWFPIDYRESQTLASGVNTFIVDNPGTFATYKLRFNDFESSTTYLNNVQLFSATASDSLALAAIEDLTSKIISTQDREEGSLLKGAFYQKNIPARYDEYNGQTFHHDTRTNYHGIITASLVQAYQVVEDTYLKRNLRYAIRLATDYLITAIQPNGQLSNWVATISGVVPNGSNSGTHVMNLSESMGMLGMIVKENPSDWGSGELEKILRLMQAHSTPVNNMVKEWFEVSASHQAYFNSVSGITDSRLYFDLR